MHGYLGDHHGTIGVIWLALVLGWMANIVHLFKYVGDGGTEYILMWVGAFWGPVGTVMGWIYLLT